MDEGATASPSISSVRDALDHGPILPPLSSSLGDASADVFHR
jgi:hypothetical protein